MADIFGVSGREMLAALAGGDDAIAEQAAPLAPLVARLDQIPGISLAAAHVILAEIGTHPPARSPRLPGHRAARSLTSG